VRRVTRDRFWPFIIALAVIAFTAAPATAASHALPHDTGPHHTSPAAPESAGLARALAAAAHLPGSAVGGIRAGSLHTGTAGGRDWAIATFLPSATAGQRFATAFQDGAATGVFTRPAQTGAWRLVRTGPYGCAYGLPVTLRARWGIARPASCSLSLPSERAAARTALAARRTAGARAAGPDIAQNIVNIALAQAGHSDIPAVTNFNVDCDPYSTMVAGFSANSDGCGFDPSFRVQNDNEEWCADLNKWVWERAGVTADMNTLNAGSISFYDWGVQQGESMPVDPSTVVPGDSLVFFGPGAINPNRYADHVGIVTAVNPDGTINMINGDFLGATNISAEYDTNINLATWAPSIWGAGEQWIAVAPPAAAQQPVPLVAMYGPRIAVTGTAGTFHAIAAEPGGSISEYYWTFGDGRTTNTTGASVSHVFDEDGRYTVTVTVTSNFGTITTRTWNVDVLGASSAVATSPEDAVWFATTPVDEYLFTRSAGGLASDIWDGSSWLQVATGGQPASTGQIAVLSYPDPQAAYAMTPHAYYRAADGSLAQTYLGTTGWVTQDLPGEPAAGSAVAAATMPDGSPAVFYVDTSGHVAESALGSGGWAVVPERNAPFASPGTLALANDAAGGPQIFTTSGHGTLTVSTPGYGDWRSRPLPASLASGGSIAAFTTAAGAPALVFTGANGTLDEAVRGPGWSWQTTSIPGAPAAGAGLSASTYLTSGATLGTEVSYLTSSGQPQVGYDAGHGWQTAALPGTVAAVAGLSAYPVAGQPSQLFLTTAGGALTEDAASDPSASWTSLSLPDSPATFAQRVVLYAATPADAAAALTAASAAGISSAQVTQDFATAWDDTLNGSYLVIAVGLPATDALYFNVCGWANPSDDVPGATPFATTPTVPVDQLPGASTYEEAAGGTAAQTAQLATDLAYYAVHGVLPPGVTSLPPEAGPEYVCSGSPS
jgi:PKD repeat protein